MIVTSIYAVAFYLATMVLVFGVASKLLRYARTPQPLVIPTTPAPITGVGVVFRLLREFFLFASLFKANKWTWVLGFLFHYGLLFALLRHLRYFTEPVWSWVVMIQWLGVYAGFAMMLGLVGLLLRRIVVDRVRYISAPSDYLSLLLLMAIGGSGLAMKFVAHTDVIAVKAFALGLLRFDLQRLPNDPLILIHLALVILLMLVFPISKMIHGLGMLFSPTLNMPDNPREKRHVTPWAASKGGHHG